MTSFRRITPKDRETQERNNRHHATCQRVEAVEWERIMLQLVNRMIFGKIGRGEECMEESKKNSTMRLLSTLVGKVNYYRKFPKQAKK